MVGCQEHPLSYDDWPHCKCLMDYNRILNKTTIVEPIIDTNGSHAPRHFLFSWKYIIITN